MRKYALASECAAKQEKFEQFYHQAFTQRQVAGSDADFFKLGRGSNVADMDLFAACLQNAEAEDRVALQAEEALSLGISGTPTWFVNGLAIGGDLPIDSVESVVLRELKRAQGR